MSHVDEGALHAYLDGALDDLPASEAAWIREHLASCKDCATRLESERAVRDQASAILAVAAPGGMDLPSLEELRTLADVRAKAGTARVVAPGRRRQLAWAASVAVALASGWMLRGAPVAPGAPGDGPMGARSVAEAPAAGGALAAREEPAAGTSAERAQTLPDAVVVDAAARGARDEVVAEPVATPAEEEAPTRMAQAPEAALRGQVQKSAETSGSAGAGVVAAPAVPAAAAPVGASAGEEVPRLGVGAASQRPAVAPLAPSPEPGPPASAARSPQSVALPTSPFSDQARQREANRDAANLLSLPVAVERLEQRLGGGAGSPEVSGSLVVPGLTVVSVSWLDDEAAGAVRVLQLLESGDTLEIVHLPPSTSPSVMPPLAADGRTGLVIPRGEGWLIVRGRATRDELEGLVRRMDGGR